MTNYLIIGGGVAGTTAAGELRKLDDNAQITILSNEKHPLYSRVMLRNYVSGAVPRERVFLKNQKWYADTKINLVFDTVTDLDTEAKVVTGKDRKEYSYDKLLIAGGGTLNRLPYSDEKNAYHFQTIEDADKLFELGKEAHEDTRHAHIIGGSFIAMDFVEVFARNDFKTTVHLRGDRLFSNALDPESSKLIEDTLKLHDVTIKKNHEVSYKSDIGHNELLGIGVGLGCRFDWANNSGVTIKNGVIANEFLETEVPDVWTAGDCAEFLDTTVGRVRRIGNWTNAQMQGRHVAHNMAGAREPFKLLSAYGMPVLKLPIVMLGDISLGHAEDIITRADKESRTQLFIRHERIVGATLINRNHERGIITKMINQKTNVSKSHSQLATSDLLNI